MEITGKYEPFAGHPPIEILIGDLAYFSELVQIGEALLLIEVSKTLRGRTLISVKAVDFDTLNPLRDIRHAVELSFRRWDDVPAVSRRFDMTGCGNFFASRGSWKLSFRPCVSKHTGSKRAGRRGQGGHRVHRVNSHSENDSV